MKRSSMVYTPIHGPRHLRAPGLISIGAAVTLDRFSSHGQLAMVIYERGDSQYLGKADPDDIESEFQWVCELMLHQVVQNGQLT